MNNPCELCIYRSFLFDNLDKKEFALLTLSRKEVDFLKGEVICKEGEKIDQFLYLKKGLLKVYKSIGDRKEQIIGVTKPMDFIGLLSVFSNATYLYSIAALEDSSICTIDLEAIKKLIRGNADFALTLLEKMSSMNDQLLKSRLTINLKNLRGRTAFILLMFAEEIYKSDNFELPVSRKEIAELIDMRTENVIRILSEFRNDGIVGIEGKNIEIIDKERLQQISDFG